MSYIKDIGNSHTLQAYKVNQGASFKTYLTEPRQLNKTLFRETSVSGEQPQNEEPPLRVKWLTPNLYKKRTATNRPKHKTFQLIL